VSLHNRGEFGPRRVISGIGATALVDRRSGSLTLVFDFETYLLDAAMPVCLHSPEALPAALVDDCEKVWGEEVAHGMGGMGHVRGYVHEFDDDEDVTLLELPSSRLIGWQLWDVYNLVITVKKSRPLAQRLPLGIRLNDERHIHQLPPLRFEVRGA
jgi:hypothetical protein